jgi:hypothetical protein
MLRCQTHYPTFLVFQRCQPQQHLVLSQLQCVSFFSLSLSSCAHFSHLVSFLLDTHICATAVHNVVCQPPLLTIPVSLISPFPLPWTTLPSRSCYLTHSVKQVVSTNTPIFPSSRSHIHVRYRCLAQYFVLGHVHVLCLRVRERIFHSIHYGGHVGAIASVIGARLETLSLCMQRNSNNTLALA